MSLVALDNALSVGEAERIAREAVAERLASSRDAAR
jgi:hypothetical protein